MPRLLADVGGTHARFALAATDGTIGASQVLRCAEHASLEAAIRCYLAAQGQPPVDAAAIAIANPVDGDAIRMTNHHWAFSIEATRRALGFDSLLLLNDFTALALALPLLDARELLPIGGGTRRPDATIGLVGPGTGLGVSGLVRCGPRWQALASEGGHTSFAPVDDREAAILTVVRRDFPHVSSERLISGPGLVLIHDALRVLQGLPMQPITPAAIAAAAQSAECAICMATAQAFSGMLGSFAGSLALTLGAFGGVYLGGGVIAGLGSAFDREVFRRRFEAKGRFAGYLAGIATVQITAVHPALRGVAAVLADHLNDGRSRG